MKKIKLPTWLGLLVTLAAGLAVVGIPIYWPGSHAGYHTSPSKPPHTPQALPRFPSPPPISTAHCPPDQYPVLKGNMAEWGCCPKGVYCTTN